MVIQFDTNDLIEKFYLNEDQVKNLIDFSIKELTASFAREWEKTANQKLGSSKNEYIQSLIVVDEGYAKGAVLLRGWLPNAVESGLESFDMKEGILNGPNAKIGENGNKYNTIPFKFGTPGSNANSFSGGIMPQEIYQIAKGKKPDQPIKREELPSKYQEPKTVSIKQPQAKNFEQYTHKAAIYEGVVKKKDSVTGQNTYMSFRRVSENSDPSSWQHPGIEARNLAEQTLENFNIPDQVGISIDNFLKSIGWQ